MVKRDGFTCERCGKFHPGLAQCIALLSPTAYVLIPARQRKKRCRLTEDHCVIDGKHFFVYGSLDLPIRRHPRPFSWGVWASLREQDFERANGLVDVEGCESEPPYFGRLASDIPLYPPCLELPVAVHTQAVGVRPLIALQPADHPLVREQQQGISVRRVQEILEWYLHGRFED